MDIIIGSIGSGFMLAMIFIAVIVIIILVAFLIGYVAGSSKVQQLKKDREHRRIIRMQARPRPKKPLKHTGYYPVKQARREQAKCRRAQKKQTKMQGK